jgi:hypothetical protein
MEIWSSIRWLIVTILCTLVVGCGQGNTGLTRPEQLRGAFDLVGQPVSAIPPYLTSEPFTNPDGEISYTKDSVDLFRNGILGFLLLKTDGKRAVMIYYNVNQQPDSLLTRQYTILFDSLRSHYGAPAESSQSDSLGSQKAVWHLQGRTAVLAILIGPRSLLHYGAYDSTIGS